MVYGYQEPKVQRIPELGLTFRPLAGQGRKRVVAATLTYDDPRVFVLGDNGTIYYHWRNPALAEKGDLKPGKLALGLALVGKQLGVTTAKAFNDYAAKCHKVVAERQRGKHLRELRDALDMLKLKPSPEQRRFLKKEGVL